MIFMRLVFFFSFSCVISAWGGQRTRSAFPQTQFFLLCRFGRFRRSPDVGLLSSSFIVYIYTTYAPSKDREGIDRCTHY